MNPKLNASADTLVSALGPLVRASGLVCLVLVLGAGACGPGEDAGSTGRISGLGASDSGGKAADAKGVSDGTGAGLCTTSCTALAPYLCSYNTQKKICVECTTDEHCKKNNAALGSRCDLTTNLCTCTADADCTGRSPGARCLTTQSPSLCGCLTDSDCPSPSRCVEELFGAKVCRKPCASNTDCRSPLAPLCDAKTGQCVACLSDTGCNAKYTPYCSQGFCVACTKDSQCLSSTKPRCDAQTGACMECSQDAQCKTWALGRGNRCLRSTLGVLQCRCLTDADCTGHPSGPTCDTASRTCTCKDDSQCAGTLKSCNEPFVGAGRRHCQKTCTVKTDCGQGLLCNTTNGHCVECKSDSDCTSVSAPYCDVAMSRCRRCKADTDCSGETPLCDASSGRCVACKTNSECTADPSGPVCSNGSCTCSTDADCQGKGMYGALCILALGVKRCGCGADGDCSKSGLGTTCYTTVRKCSCTSTTECTTQPFSICRTPYAGAAYKSCVKPCASDKECPSKEAGVCDSVSGICQNCLTNAHCSKQAWAKVCHTTRFRCVECMKDSDCTTSTLGSKCVNNLCGCAKDADCASNAHGKFCDLAYQVCACKTTTDCPTGKTCKDSSLGSAISLCQ